MLDCPVAYRTGDRREGAVSVCTAGDRRNGGSVIPRIALAVVRDLGFLNPHDVRGDDPPHDGEVPVGFAPGHRPSTRREGGIVMARTTRISWEECPRELWRRWQEEPDPHRRARLQALVLVQGGATLAEAGRAVGVDERSIQRWLGWYRTGGLAEVLRRVPGHGDRGRRPRLTAEREAELVARIASGEIATIRAAVVWVDARWGVPFTYKGMHALLRRARRRGATDSALSSVRSPRDGDGTQ